MPDMEVHGALPPGTRDALQTLIERSGLGAEVEASADSFLVKLKQDRKLVGYFRVSTVIMGGFSWEQTPEECKTAWAELGKPPLWAVRSAEWFDTSLKGRGLGSLAYEAMFEYVRSKQGVVGPDMCGGGATSAEARRVWDRFRSKYQMHGPLLRFASKIAVEKLRSTDFRPTGRVQDITDILGVNQQQWDKMEFREKLRAAQNSYLKLAKRPKLTKLQLRQQNALKRWFNIQKRTHKPWRSKIETFFDSTVNRIRERKRKQGSLRANLVRVAFENPETRESLLPLILRG